MLNGSIWDVQIRCPLGSESVREAMKEVEAHRRFRHPNCIRCLDSAVVQEADGKVIYLFLPYYKRGNLQDAMNANAVRRLQCLLDAKADDVAADNRLAVLGERDA